MRSFLSEHTAEYCLVSQAVKAFSSYVGTAIPIYFWSTREGNRLAQQSLAGQELRIVSVFARRPKISGPCAESMTAKLNRELFHYASEAESLGISTLAGMPLVTSLNQLRLDCPCAWFRLFKSHDLDTEITMSLRGQTSEIVPSFVTGPAPLESLAEDAFCAASTVEWGDAIEILRTLRQVTRSGVFYGGYNPFHLLLMD